MGTNTPDEKDRTMWAVVVSTSVQPEPPVVRVKIARGRAEALELAIGAAIDCGLLIPNNEEFRVHAFRMLDILGYVHSGNQLAVSIVKVDA